MIRNIKKSKGITLISMILAVIVLLIIVGTISYSSRNSLQKKKLDNFFNDIGALSDAVSVYYIKNGTLPVYYSKYDINGNNGEYREICLDNTDLNIPKFDYDDISSYYILDISKLEDISLNNSNNIPGGIDTGKFLDPNNIDENDENYKTDKDKLEKSIKDGIFIVNSLSHVVYYTNGIKVDGNTYYTKIIDYSKIPTFSKVNENSVEEEIIKSGENKNELEDNTLRIVFWANGGTNAPDDIIVSKSNKGNSKDSLGYTLTNGSKGVGEPINLGMNFIGWAEEEKGSVKYRYNVGGSQNHSYKTYSVEEEFNDTKFSEYPETVINLYAVWEKDTSKIFKCYYPAGTGGIKPSISNSSVKRTGEVEAVSYPICIDIPSSGYTISWTWENGSNDIQQAKYVGESTTTTLGLETTTYETTEPGSIQLVGSFLDLSVYINDKTTGKIKIILDEKGKDVKFYKAKTIQNSETKDEAGDLAKIGSQDAIWMTGNDGKFTVPSNPKTYSALGVIDPERGTDYTKNKLNQNKIPNFYLKSAILTDSTNLTNVNYKDKTKDLGSIVDISEDSDKQYCLYPRFGSRNYKIVDDENHEYYHENLEEAYNQICQLQNSGKNCNTVVLLRSVYRSLTSGKDIPIDEKDYVKNYDPTYDKTVEFASNNIVLDFSNYTITREGSIKLSNNVELTTKSSNSGINEKYGLIFKKVKDNEGIKLEKESKLYLLGGISLKNEDGVVIGLYDNSKFYGIYGLVENTSLSNQNAIKSESNDTRICLGISKDELDEIDDTILVSDNNIIIKTKIGYAINTEGKIYWKAGILKTKDIINKQGYNDSAKIIVSRRSGEKNKKEPCIAYDTENEEIKIRLGKRDWKWEDDDSGASKTYYSAYLGDANNSLNLKKSSKLYTIKWLNPVEDSGEYNNAVINKKLKIDFNCFDSSTPKFKTSSLSIVSKDVEIRNLYCETTKGIKVAKNSSLKIDDCFIGANAVGIDAIKNEGKIIYTSSETNRCGFYTKSTGHAIYNNSGDITYNIGRSNKDKIYTESTGKAIFNQGRASFKYIGNSSPSNSIYSSDSSTVDYVLYNGSNCYMEYIPGSNGILEAKNTSKAIYNAGEFICTMGTIKSNSTKTSNNYTVYNSKLFKLCGTAKIQSNYIGIYNSGASAISCIYDQAKIESQGGGINTNNGKVYVASRITINNDNSVSLSNDSNTLSGPEITGVSKYGIYVSNASGMLTLGANESPVSVSKSSPVIKSDKLGVSIQSGSKFNFYDGVIKGKENSIQGTVTSTPENYAVGKIDESISGNTYKISVLGPSKPTITAKLNNSSGTSYKSGTLTNQNIYISLSSSKIGAGIKEYQWYENGKWVTRALTTKNNKGTITYKVNRNETLRFRAIDNNGVISEESTIKVIIDKTR